MRASEAMESIVKEEESSKDVGAAASATDGDQTATSLDQEKSTVAG